MVQTADGSPEEGATRNGDDMSKDPMWAHIIRLLDDEEQAATDAAEADPKARRATTTKTNCR